MRYIIHRDELLDIWLNSTSFKKFWRSYFAMVIQPRRCLKLINFAIKILIKFELDDETMELYK